ncbi:hypothetical protein CFN78_08010 [Amycolatopsis antarctica]|uniref:Uncharacterized protein n=1 Tax=Amycolatopsis antarctica TaxID=1854586 RepID=A0A263D7M1_9PSEU|nr:hypothetical protein [Amycolatopsis antarctica]OZM73486.1 hypothetical protein CFN78_08010 [Amycolatopsis antarctica]
MTGDEPHEPPRKTDRRTLDEVFGEVLPDTTRDERDDRPSSGSPDRWYLENRPPHHDR